MKTCLPLAALFVLPLLQPTSASACGGYGAYFQPVDSVVANLVDPNPRVAIAAWRHLVELGDEGVVRLETAVRVEQQRLEYREDNVMWAAKSIAKYDPQDERMPEWKRNLERQCEDLARTKRILKIAAPLIEPLKRAIRTNAPTA